ncbi:hypothetical protein B0H10DRAFT_2221502 [Mycena sp. CBHHK59/15]|nr:hypothetical protein B0H10DRAFT_2221502 [Mycena sp. CBHHK59/15]
MRYLNGHRHLSITYGPAAITDADPFEFFAYTDADYASNPDDRKSYPNLWCENLIVLSCIRLRIGETDQRLIHDDTIASVAWAKLKAAHLPSGTLLQLTIFQESLVLRYTCEIPLKQTTDKIQAPGDSFFAIKPPTEDKWRSLLFLNAMSGTEFNEAHSALDTLLSAGTLMPSAVISRINHEQIHINTENAEAAASEASFAAFNKRYEVQGGTGKPEYPNGQGPCANPQFKGSAKHYHDWDHCYGPGGRIKRPKGHQA